MKTKRIVALVMVVFLSTVAGGADDMGNIGQAGGPWISMGLTEFWNLDKQLDAFIKHMQGKIAAAKFDYNNDGVFDMSDIDIFAGKVNAVVIIGGGAMVRRGVFSRDTFALDGIENLRRGDFLFLTDMHYLLCARTAYQPPGRPVSFYRVSMGALKTLPGTKVTTMSWDRFWNPKKGAEEERYIGVMDGEEDNDHFVFGVIESGEIYIDDATIYTRIGMFEYAQNTWIPRRWGGYDEVKDERLISVAGMPNGDMLYIYSGTGAASENRIRYFYRRLGGFISPDAAPAGNLAQLFGWQPEQCAQGAPDLSRAVDAVAYEVSTDMRADKTHRWPLWVILQNKSIFFYPGKAPGGRIPAKLREDLWPETRSK